MTTAKNDGVVFTLWRWSVKNDEWQFATQSSAGVKVAARRNYLRREPRGAVVRWTSNGAPPARKYRLRTLKVAAV